MESLLNLDVSYRPLEGYDGFCSICTLPVPRYGKVVTHAASEPTVGLSPEYDLCSGHAIRVS